MLGTGAFLFNEERKRAHDAQQRDKDRELHKSGFLSGLKVLALNLLLYLIFLILWLNFLVLCI